MPLLRCAPIGRPKKPEQAEAQVNRLTTEQAELATQLSAERSQAEEKLTLLLEAKEALSNQFKSLANDILEEKAKRFTEQNQTNIGQLLDPLKERITEFKAKVEEIHSKDTEQQATLKAELMQLKDLNRQMTEEAHGLATALKGQAKKQGNWGELVLGNVLDRSGLREGKDFKREVSFNTEEGRKRPDVVIYLPQAKHLVIDAKVSLNAYTRYVNAEDDLVRQQALQEHVSAVASRIQELSNRVYFDLPGLNSPEMVFMFIPIESAFVEALRADETLFQTAIRGTERPYRRTRGPRRQGIQEAGQLPGQHGSSGQATRQGERILRHGDGATLHRQGQFDRPGQGIRKAWRVGADPFARTSSGQGGPGT